MDDQAEGITALRRRIKAIEDELSQLLIRRHAVADPVLGARIVALTDDLLAACARRDELRAAGAGKRPERRKGARDGVR